jgi:hypothetical protein
MPSLASIQGAACPGCNDWSGPPPGRSPLVRMHAAQSVTRCPSPRAFRPESPRIPNRITSANIHACGLSSVPFLPPSRVLPHNADTMPYRVAKKTKPNATPRPKTVQRDVLVESILLSPIAMKNPCAFCEKRGLSCEASPSDSSRCVECVRHTQSFCEAQGVSSQQLRKLSATYSKLDAEMERAEEEWFAMGAKVKRLRQQKRLWAEKMARAISRGIDSVEELEELERQEAGEATNAAAQAAASSPAVPVPGEPLLDSSWAQGCVPVSFPSLLASC